VAITSVGAYELGLELIERARLLNPHYPGFYFFVEFVVHMHNGQFEQAWEDAQLMRLPGILWQPMWRAAALGKLGRAEEAQPYLEELLQIKPDFLQRPRDSIRPLFVTDEHVDMIWDGLRRAGISLYDG
jgi:tetratricopeptide (TPR) repeat protein